MSAKKRKFTENLDDGLADINMSDEELDALIDGAGATRASTGGSVAFRPETNLQSLASGERVSGVVVEVRAGEVLVELDSKNHGVIEEASFDDDPVPAPGNPIQATFVRYDKKRKLAVLSVEDVRREIFWDELHPGLQLEGLVSDVNKGGLTLAIKDIRAFMPVSQIERHYVEDASVYVGQKLRCEVVSFDRDSKNLVVSRRAVLEREAEKLREKAMADLVEGSVVEGTVVRLTKFGAFIDVGGVEGLLHQSRILEYGKELGKDRPLEEGQKLEVQVERIDMDRGRIALDFRARTGPPAVEVGAYSEGHEVVCWIKEITERGALVTIDETVPAHILGCDLRDHEEVLKKGNVIKAVVTHVDKEKGRIEVKPL